MKICFIDIETTGINVFEDDVVQLGAVLVDENLSIIKEFTSLIKPFTGKTSSIIAKAVHGIEDKVLDHSPSEGEVLEDFFNDFGTSFFFCGWNLNFDLSFFRRMCYRNNQMTKFNEINHRHLDLQSVVKFSKAIGFFPEHLSSLQDYCNFFNIKRSDYHQALEDAFVTKAVLEKLLFEYKSKLNVEGVFHF